MNTVRRSLPNLLAFAILFFAPSYAKPADKLKPLDELRWASDSSNVFWSKAEWQAWAKKEAAQGQPVAMTELGLHADDDKEREMWKGRALAAAKTGLSAGDPVARFVAGSWAGMNIPERCAQLKAAVDGGFKRASYSYILFCVKEDLELLKLHRLGAEAGEPNSQAALGGCHGDGRCTLRVESGTNFPADAAESLRWLLKASEQGNQYAMVDAGRAYRKGNGTPRDPVEAYKWFWLAQNPGNADALSALKEVTLELTSDQIADARKRADAIRAAAKARRPKP